jgi:hypothetical protein
LKFAADHFARIPTMTATMVADQAELRRLVEFAGDVTRLADERADLEDFRIVQL